MVPPPLVTRREFVGGGLGLVGVGAALPSFLVRAAAAEALPRGEERILVVLLLSGGQDGPSCVVPYAHEGYARKRKTTFIAPDHVLPLNEEVGFHPNLKALKELYDRKMVAVVNGAGYPNPNYSHFESMDIWQAADPRGKAVGTGWLGRACDIAFRGNGDPTLSVAVGEGVAPLALRGREHPGLSFSRPDAFRYRGHREVPARKAVYEKLNASPAEGSESLQFITRTVFAANAASEALRERAARYKPRVAYPEGALGRSLATVAGLIAGDLPTRIYFLSYGGFDTHADQRPQHDRLMAGLDAALGAFVQDLERQALWSRVLVMTFSEFGRRPEENGSRGTDHGSAGPMLLLGPGVRGGVYFKHPSFEDLNPQGNFKHAVDFRCVYAAVLEKWLGAPGRSVLGEGFPPVDCLV